MYAPAGMAQLNQIRSLQALAGLLNTQYAVPLGQYPIALLDKYAGLMPNTPPLVTCHCCVTARQHLVLRVRACTGAPDVWCLGTGH